MNIPAYVQVVLDRLWDAGYPAYPVGGCVRDELLGKEPGDWDICTQAQPEQTAAVFGDMHLIQTGLRHGTVTVMSQHRPVEVTTFRTESGYGDNRHPDAVCFVTSLEEDLARRDFTINAMAYDRQGQVIDLYGGQADLGQGLIRCVGEPDRRFQEDALRLLRALRFASRLGFSLEEETAAAIHRNRALLAHISQERIFSELKGILVGAGVGTVLRQFGDVVFAIIPELSAEQGFDQHNRHHIHDIWTHTAHAVQAIDPEPVLRLTMLLHDVGKPETYFTDEAGQGHFYGHAQAGERLAETILRRLRCDNATRQTVKTLIHYHDIQPPQTEKALRRLVNKVGLERVQQLVLCWKADSSDRAPAVRQENERFISVTEELLQRMQKEETVFSQRDLAVNGRDILALGVKPGAQVGQILAQLFQLVTEENIPNEREILLERAKQYQINLKNGLPFA
jgi:tRNA nucleotidyltransferase (CCA-adding enzyme)